MKILLLSDMHLEFASFKYRGRDGISIPEVDAIILAGDIGTGASGFAWAEYTFKECNVPVFYVAGNHEYYSKQWPLDELNDHLRKKNSFVRFLQNDHVILNDTVFVGGTLWTDFSLNGSPELDMVRATGVMNDYNWIQKTKGVKITPEFILEQNQETRNYIKTVINENPDKKVVVVTHHGPFSQSLDVNRYKCDKDSVYYTNKIEMDYEFPLPTVWVHGHIHTSLSYEMGDCKVMTNPRGYHPCVNDGKIDNHNFNPMFVFDV